jgi:hypothetical protein
LAEISTDAVPETKLVCSEKVAIDSPSGIVTLEGTVAMERSLLDSDSTTPPGGAAPFKITVACEVLPPETVVEPNLSPSNRTLSASRVRSAVLVRPYVAEIVICVENETDLVTTLKGASVSPSGMVTLAGIAASTASLLVMGTVTPPLGAAALSVTVACKEIPPFTTLRSMVSADSLSPLVPAVLVTPLASIAQIHAKAESRLPNRENEDLARKLKILLFKTNLLKF